MLAIELKIWVTDVSWERKYVWFDAIKKYVILDAAKMQKLMSRSLSADSVLSTSFKFAFGHHVFFISKESLSS